MPTCTLCAAEESPGFYTGCMVRDGHAPEWDCDGQGNPSRRDFRKSLDSFYEGCRRIAEDYRLRNFPSLQPSEWHIQELVKRWRIIKSGSVHCFVDKETGDVLKPASWSKPAKHARGNIFDEHNGLAKMGPYGPAYLR